MSGWTKLFSTIVTSSIWVEDDATLRVWIAMLASADASGIVEGSSPGFASLARVTTEQMRTSVNKLSSPDLDSRTPDHEGRRIETIEGGWRILNYGVYRARPQAKEGSKAPAMRAYRARLRLDRDNALPHNATRYPENRSEKQNSPVEPQNGSTGGDPPNAHRPPRSPDRSHRNHAHCGRLCMHSSLFNEFVRRRNHLDAEHEIRDWCMEVEREWSGGGPKSAFETGDAFDFWRARYAERWPTAPEAAAPIQQKQKFGDRTFGNAGALHEFVHGVRQ